MGTLLHPNRIAQKLIAGLIVFSTLLTLISTGVQLSSEYNRDLNAIHTRFSELERGYIDSITNNVRKADTGRLKILVNGIIAFPDFVHANVRDQAGTILVTAGPETDKNLIRKTYPLYYTFRGDRQYIGQLEITASLTLVHQRTWDRVWLILGANGIKALFVSLFMFALVYWLLTRHLDAMVRFVRDMDFSTHPKSLHLARGWFAGKPDEMDLLATALNEMQDKLFKSYLSLRTFSDELEENVRDRTRDLSKEIEVRRLTAKQLSNSEEQLRDIAEAGSDWMWEMGPDLRFTFISGSAITSGVLVAANIIGHHADELSTDIEDQDKWRQHTADLESHLPFRDFEYKMRTSINKDWYVRSSGKPIFDDDGNFLGYRGIGNNITPLVEAKLKATEAEDQLRILSSAIQQNPSAIYITDKHGLIEYVNVKFTEFTGYTFEETVGQNPRILKSPHTPPEIHTSIWQKITKGEEWRGEIQDRCKDGSDIWAYAIIAPVKNDAGEITHFIATHEDIAERKKAEEQLRIASSEAQVANRAKSELMANMSHELRTPLNAIIGFSDTILNNVFGPLNNVRYEEYIRDINHSGIHLLDLINDILDVSAIEAGKMNMHPERVQVTDLIHNCLKLVQHRATDSKVLLDSHIEKDIPDLLADERRIKQVLLNLLSNAVKFTPESGTVTLSAQCAPDGGIRIEVEDTGIGMDEVGIEIALRRFGQVDSDLARKYEGTGLGLPLSKSLVEAHQGALDIHSRLRHGTTIVVHFPPERSLPKDTDASMALYGEGDVKSTVH